MAKSYEKPRLEKLGSMAALTLTGLTRPGTDVKSGSQPSEGI